MKKVLFLLIMGLSMAGCEKNGKDAAFYVKNDCEFDILVSYVSIKAANDSEHTNQRTIEIDVEAGDKVLIKEMYVVKDFKIKDVLYQFNIESVHGSVGTQATSMSNWKRKRISADEDEYTMTVVPSFFD